MSEDFDFGMATPAGSLHEINADRLRVRRAFLRAGVERRLLDAIRTRATKSGRRQTGKYQSNREARWKLQPDDPQYGTEVDCKIIELRLMGFLLAFSKPPPVDEGTVDFLAERYLGTPPVPGTYRDSLLLEPLDFAVVAEESVKPTQGVSKIHLGHENPAIQPKHVPSNVAWRTERSNLIQGDMTLREARIYIIKLIARYFDLGEVEVAD